MIDKLRQELAEYKDTLVITDSWDIARLDDVVTEPEDYYWKYDTRNGYRLESCVGGWCPLKGFIRDENYNRLVRIWNLNNIEKAI